MGEAVAFGAWRTVFYPGVWVGSHGVPHRGKEAARAADRGGTYGFSGFPGEAGRWHGEGRLWPGECGAVWRAYFVELAGSAAVLGGQGGAAREERVCARIVSDGSGAAAPDNPPAGNPHEPGGQRRGEAESADGDDAFGRGGEGTGKNIFSGKAGAGNRAEAGGHPFV